MFHWDPSDSKCPQISWTLLSILTDLNDAVIWMVFILPHIANSYCFLFNPFGDHSKCPNNDWNHCHSPVP